MDTEVMTIFLETCLEIHLSDANVYFHSEKYGPVLSILAFVVNQS